MPQFFVPVSRTATHTMNIMVEATTEAEAEMIALGCAGDHNFHDGTSGEADYQIEGPARLASA